MTLVQIYYEVEGTAGAYSKLEQLGVDIRPAQVTDYGEVRLDRACDATIGAAASNVRLVESTFANAPNLRLCAGYTIGYDHIDLPAASTHGVLVANNSQESNWGGVAEATVACMLTLLKRVRERDEAVRMGKWNEDDGLMGRYVGARVSDDTNGISIGIVGFGRVGRRFAELMQPWRAQIYAVDPAIPDSELLHLNVTPADFITVVTICDVIVICCDLNDSSVGLFGLREFELMKPNAILINPARALIVNQADLITALENDKLGGVALDVFESEPLPANSRFRTIPKRHLLSPHMFGMSEDTALKDSAHAVEARVLTALRGEVPTDIVNPHAVNVWLQRYGFLDLLQEAG